MMFLLTSGGGGGVGGGVRGRCVLELMTAKSRLQLNLLYDSNSRERMLEEITSEI